MQSCSCFIPGLLGLAFIFTRWMVQCFFEKGSAHFDHSFQQATFRGCAVSLFLPYQIFFLNPTLAIPLRTKFQSYSHLVK